MSVVGEAAPRPSRVLRLKGAHEARSAKNRTARMVPSWCRTPSWSFAHFSLNSAKGVSTQTNARNVSPHAHTCWSYSNHLHDSSKPRAVTLPASSPLRQSTSCCSRPHPAPSFSSSIATAPAHAGSSEQYLCRKQSGTGLGQQLALPRLLSAPEHGSGCPKLATLRWPAPPATLSTWASTRGKPRTRRPRRCPRPAA